MHAGIRDEQGFTLIELLVVILIIGILAAIAIPSFIGQRQKAQDTDAKSNARSLVTHVESCYTATSDFGACKSASELADTGLPLGSGEGQVEVVSADKTSYTVTAHSRSGGTFSVVRDAKGIRRECAGDTKGCNGGSW